MTEAIDPWVEDECIQLEHQRDSDEYGFLYRASFISLFGKDPFLRIERGRKGDG